MITSHSFVPYARRRNTPAQLDALNQLFDATPHPTRAQRQALANELGMELKSVTNWFQNRRQTVRKKTENITPRALSPPCHAQKRPKTPLDRSKISLDRIVALSERPGATLQLDSTRSPLTPRKGNGQILLLPNGPSSPSELWTHMLSSPVVPRSSPDPEEVRLTALSSRARILFPLEWACLQARQKKWVDEDAGGSTHLDSGHFQEVDMEIMDGDLSNQRRNNALFTRPSMAPQFEDVEAAITLLGFKTHS